MSSLSLREVHEGDFDVPSLAPTSDRNFVNAYKVQNGQLAAVIHFEKDLYVCRFHKFIEDTQVDQATYYSPSEGFDIEHDANLGIVQNSELEIILEHLVNAH